MDFYRPPTTQGTLDALGMLYRAVQAWKFYPKGHPTRRSRLDLAHAALLQLLDGNALSLTCGRNGFSFPDGEFLKDTSGATAALSFELFIRRAQKLTLSPDLFQEDLLALCKILSLSPEEIMQSGGIDTVMAGRGVRSIWVNEFDLTIIRAKRQKIEQTGIIPQGIDDSETGDEVIPANGVSTSQPDELPPELQFQELLGRLTLCVNDDVYLRLLHQIIACADNLQSLHKQHLLFPLIELLATHSTDEARSECMQKNAQYALERLITTGEILQVVLDRAEQDNSVSQTTLRTVLKAGGAAAITAAVNLMGRTGSLKVRRMFSSMLGSLGEEAVPALLDLMHDPRWFIIRNICAILGSIASNKALAALTTCLHHPDLRVRKEAIRSLAQLGGHEAETAILAILRSTDTALYPQAIASLGGMKSRISLAELMKIVFSRDLFLKSLPLKIDALAAIASIGAPQVTPHLATLLGKRHLFAAARGKQLKAAIAACLGRLGDPRALPSLEKRASDGGYVGSACSDAIELIEKSEGKTDGNP